MTGELTAVASCTDKNSVALHYWTETNVADAADICHCYALHISLHSSLSDSAVNNDSSEISVDDDTNEVNSAEGGGKDDTNEDDTPSIEVADEPYVAQASAEDSLAAALTDDDDGDSKEDSSEDNDESGEQIAGASTEDGDSKEGASDDDQTVEGEKCK